MQGYQIVNRIKARVAELGLTMAEFYKDCGISSGAVSQWRSGRTAPSMASLQNIAVYLGVPLSQLLEETKSPAPNEGEAEREEFIRLYQAAPAWLQDQVRSLLKAAEDDHAAQGDDPTE